MSTQTKRVILLELDVRDAFYDWEFADKLIGREFVGVFLLEEIEKDSEFKAFSGNLIGDGVFDNDDLYYLFAYAKVEEVPEPL